MNNATTSTLACYKFRVRLFTILFSDRNSLRMTFMEVYTGTATIIPKIPNKIPAMIITKNISKGCDFTLLENIKG